MKDKPESNGTCSYLQVLELGCEQGEKNWEL